MRNNALPKSLACVGLVFGIGSLLYLPFFLINLQFLVLFVMALIVMSPI